MNELENKKATKMIVLEIHLTDDLGLKTIVFQYNDSGLKSDYTLLYKIAWAILKSIHSNEDYLKMQEMLSELNIALPKT